MICLKSPSLDALVDPSNVQNDLASLTSILAIEALTVFVMRVNYDRGKPLFNTNLEVEGINSPRIYGTPL